MRGDRCEQKKQMFDIGYLLFLKPMNINRLLGLACMSDQIGYFEKRFII
jgi:hypothetical protein